MWPRNGRPRFRRFRRRFLPRCCRRHRTWTLLQIARSGCGNLQGLYLNGSRYSNLCTATFAAAMALWASPVMHVWLGPKLPMRESLIPLFVVFSLAMQFHMLTGPGTSIFRGMGRVYEEFNYSVPNLLLLGITLPLSRWVIGSWTPLGIGIAVAVATAGSACVLMGRVLFVLESAARAFSANGDFAGIGALYCRRLAGLAHCKVGGGDEPLARGGSDSGGGPGLCSCGYCNIALLDIDGRGKAKGN